MRRPKRAAFTTISLANSIPVVLRPILSIASLRNARMPQWKSETRDPEEEAAEEGEDGVAEPAVKGRHRARLDPPAEPRAHDEVVPLLERRDEGRDLAEVVGVVGVAHDDVAPARRRDAAEERGAVAALGDGDDARPGPVGDLLRAVGRAVVGDDRPRPRGPRRASASTAAPHAALERLGLVQAGHHDGDEERAGASIGRLSPESGARPGIVRSAWP